jgi:thioredoxin 1
MYTKLHILALAFLMSGCGAAPRRVEVVEEEVVREPAEMAKAGSNFIELENDSQFNDAIASGKFVVVDFFAEWCGPCKQFGPTFKKVSSEFPNIIFIKVDIDKSSSISSKYGIQSVPTIKIFAKGNATKPIQEFVGPKKAGEFRKILEALGA